MNKADMLKARSGDSLDDSLGGAPAPARPAAPAVTKTTGRGRNDLDINQVVPDPDQPRKTFVDAEIEQMAESLRTLGQLQPVRVRWKPELTKWVIIDGEQRYRAALRAGLSRMLCVFVEEEQTPSRTLLEQLIANCQRSDLPPLERAQAFKRLMDMNGWSQEQLAAHVHLSVPTISRSLDLLNQPEHVQQAVAAGEISPKQAKLMRKDHAAKRPGPRRSDDQPRPIVKLTDVSLKLIRNKGVEVRISSRARLTQEEIVDCWLEAAEIERTVLESRQKRGAA